MTYKLYGSPLSPYMHAVQIVFAEHNITYEFSPVGPTELASPDYGALHPYRKLPVLQANGTRIFETAAIMMYVDELGSCPIQPSDPLQHAHSNQWLGAANSYMYRDAFTNLYFKRVLAPRFGFDVDEGAIADGAEKTASHLAHVEHAISLGELGGEMLHLGDILVGCIFVPLQDIEEGQKLLAGNTATNKWLKRLASRPSFLATQP